MISEAAMGGGKGSHISYSLCGPVEKKALDVGGPSLIDFIYFWGRIRSSEAAMGGGGAQRPLWGCNDLKKTGARSARARTRGQNPLVIYILLYSNY
jgi:hypothetical protein